MEDLLRILIAEQIKTRQAQEKTNELLENISTYNGENPNELLTVEQIIKEFKIGKVKVLKMFQDPELPVQRYTKPFKVTRKAVNDYINVRHDDLCN